MQQNVAIVKEEISRNPKVARGWVARVLPNGELEFVRSLQWSKFEVFFKPDPSSFYIVKKDTSSWKNKSAYYWLKQYDSAGNATVIAEVSEWRGGATVKFENQVYDEEAALSLLDKYGCLNVQKGQNRWVQLLIKIALERMQKVESKAETEEVSVEEALEGWGIAQEGMEVQGVVEGSEVTEVETTAVKEEVSLTEEEVEKVKRKVLGERFLETTVVVFKLPTEYLAAKKKFKKDKTNGKIIEEIVFETDPNVFRTLRKKFYTLLNKVAWRAELGWILMTQPNQRELEAFNDVIKALNRLGKKERSVEFVQCFLPRFKVIQWLRDYIAEVRESKEELERKIREELEDLKKIKAAQRRLDELKERLIELERELERLASSKDYYFRRD